MSNQAYFYLVKLISARDYSEHKLREKLREKKYSSTEIDQAIGEIKVKGYLREDAYTRSRVRVLMDKGYSPDFIRQKLGQEHLSISTLEVEEVFEEYKLSVNDQMDRLIRKKLQNKTELDFEEENKILRYLISKGHDYGRSKSLLKLIVTEEK